VSTRWGRTVASVTPATRSTHQAPAVRTWTNVLPTTTALGPAHTTAVTPPVASSARARPGIASARTSGRAGTWMSVRPIVTDALTRVKTFLVALSAVVMTDIGQSTPRVSVNSSFSL